MNDHNSEQISVERQGEISIVLIKASDVSDENLIAEIFEQAADAVVDDEGPRIILDFAHVKNTSSTLLGKLVVFQRQVTRRSGHMVLCNLREEINHVLEVTNLHEFVTIRKTRQEAEEALNP